MQKIIKLLTVVVFITTVMPAYAQVVAKSEDWEMTEVIDQLEGTIASRHIGTKSLEYLKGWPDKKEKIEWWLSCSDGKNIERFIFSSTMGFEADYIESIKDRGQQARIKLGKEPARTLDFGITDSFGAMFIFDFQVGFPENLFDNLKSAESNDEKLRVEMEMFQVGFNQVATFSLNGVSEMLEECNKRPPIKK